MLEWMLMPLRRYAQFSGRSRRKEYWSFVLFTLIVYVVLVGIMLAGGFPAASMMDPAVAPAAPGGLFMVGVGLAGLFALAMFIPNIAVTVRRLHDRNMSGWFLLLFIVLSALPYIGVLVSIGWLVLMALPGTPGPNKYGPDPKDPGAINVFS